MSVILSRGDNRVGGVSSDAVLRREYAKRMTAPGQAVLRRHGAAPASLFENGEQGAWYDPSDFSNMFQDSVGTTPVTAVEQPVGFILDKRLGLARSPLSIVGKTAGDGVVTVVGNVITVTGGTSSTDVSFSDYYSFTLLDLTFSAANSIVVYAGGYPSMATAGRNTYTGAAGVYNIIRVPAGAPTTTITVHDAYNIIGNHAYQTTTTSRPTLSARYNLLTNTSFAGAVAGAPGIAPTGWAFGFATGEISAVTPLGPDFAIQIATSATRLVYTQQLTAAPNVTYSHWIDVLETTAITAINFIGLTAQPSGATLTYWFNGELITGTTVISSPGRLEMRMTVGGTGGSYYVRFGVGCSGNITGIATIARPDVRVTNDGVGLPPYQRVVDANTYDTVGFPPYLKFDGVDDFLQTASVDFSGTDKLFASAALRKLSDAHAGIVVELSLVSNSNPGTFALLAPSGATPTMGVYLRGATTLVTKNALSGIASPASGVLTGVFDLAAITQQARIRINGQPEGGSASSDAGGGVFGSYPLYVGRRGLNTSTMFNGRLYSLLIRGAATPDATVAMVESYLNQKARIY